MINFQLILNKNITGRAAAQLNWALSSLKSSIRIINKEGRMVNATSLVGLLSGQIREGDLITISFDQEDEEQRIKFYFRELGIIKEV